MVKRIFLSIFLITLVALLITSVTVFAIAHSYYDDQIISELAREAEYVKAGIELSGQEYLQEFNDSDMRITLIDRDGKVLYDNKADPSSMTNHLDREEIKEAFQSGEGSSTRYSDTLAERTYYYAARLSDGSVIRFSGARYSPWVIIADIVTPLISIILLLLIASALASIALSRRIVQPIIDIDIDNPEKSTPTYKELRPVVQRLTEQKQRISAQISELQIRRSEFEAITSNMTEGMMIVDTKASILSCNSSALRILGYDGELPLSALAVSSISEFRHALLSSLSGERFEDTIKSKSRCYRIIGTPVLEDGNVCGAVIVLLDETEKERREALRREFTSNVSHELKTPLTSISGYAELIRDGLTDTEQTVVFADKIHKESGRMISLIGDIIKLSQLDGKEIPFDKTRIDLLELAENAVDRLSSIAKKQGVTVTAEGEPSYIEGNAVIAEDMIYNLCDNAIKYNREGGYVKIHVGHLNGSPFFFVEDNGIGSPADETDRIFERFYRVDKSHSRQIGGTGLGLSIVKHGAIYHNARITVESRLGEGTRISVIF